MGRYVIGIDEVGRGPLAGPVSVGVVMATPRMLKKFSAIKESKQLSRLQREEWAGKIKQEEGEDLRFAVSAVSAAVIDKKGIVFAINSALSRSIKKMNADPRRIVVLLDGGLHAPKEYACQTTIIRGDEKETVIAMASVIAKVTRDRWMLRMAKKYPKYGFEKHVGYGTRAHIAAMQKFGLSEIHRKTFCKNFAKKKPA